MEVNEGLKLLAYIVHISTSTPQHSSVSFAIFKILSTSFTDSKVEKDLFSTSATLYVVTISVSCIVPWESNPNGVDFKEDKR